MYEIETNILIRLFSLTYILIIICTL